MKLKCQTTKCICAKGDFRIFGCIPLEENKVKVNPHGSFTIIGDNISALNEWSEYELVVEEFKKYKGEMQYKVVSIPSIEAELNNLSDETEYDLLCQITTEGQSKFINQSYPNFIRMILNGQKDEIDVKKIYNVGDVRLAYYIREIEKKFKYLQIMSQFKEYDLSMEDCKALGVMYKSINDMADAMNTQPYHCMIEVMGKSFSMVDDRILKVQPELADSFQRTEFAILDILDRNENDGNTKINANIMARFFKEEVPECYKNIKQVAIDSDRIYYDDTSKDIAKMATYLAEEEIAHFLLTKNAKDSKLDIDCSKYRTVDGFTITEEQGGMLQNFVDHEFSILLGGAGSGKSSSVKALIALLEDNKLSYINLCPTGKASSRLKECINRPTSTVHRQLAMGDLIDTDVVLVDEFSFFDVMLSIMLLRGMGNPNIRLVIIADEAQLPSIGCGRVLLDIIESEKFPITRLTKIFRYADGGIMKVATDIRNGICPLSDEPVQHLGKDYTFYQCSDDEILDKVVEEYSNLLQRGANPKDIMVLSPWNVGDFGTYNINNQIQYIVNPPREGEIVHTIKIKRERFSIDIAFKKGDLVLNTKNDYKALPYDSWLQIQDNEYLDEDCVEKTTVYNGDVAKVMNIDDKNLFNQFGEELVVFNKQKMYQLLLAYSISVHKSQGSQAKYVINIISPTHASSLNRNLLYVADSRSCGEHIDIGDIATFREAINNIEPSLRRTFLKDLLIRGFDDIKGGDNNE